MDKFLDFDKEHVSLLESTGLSDRITSSERTKVNRALMKAGFDGNGRFQSVGYANNVLSGILDQHGFEFDVVLSADLFSAPSKFMTLRMARKNSQDAFSPVSIKNSLLAYSYHKDGSKLEIISYMS